jgi:hypothetical protein
MTTAFVRSFFVYIDFHTNSTWLGAYDKRFLVVPIGTLGSVAFLLAATLYQGYPDRNHKLWDIVYTERYILHMQVLLEYCFI